MVLPTSAPETGDMGANPASAAHGEPAAEPEQPAAKPEELPVKPARPARKPVPALLKWTIGAIAAAAVLLLAFVALSRIAPDFTDKLLYTQEELEILNYPEDGLGLPR